MSRGRTWSALTATLLLGVVPVGLPASAQSRPTAHLAFEGAAGACFDEAALRTGVATQLGYDPFVDESDREVQVAATRSADGPAVRIEVIDREGQRAERNLAGSDAECDALREATVLAVCIAIDPTGFVADPPSPEPDLPEPTPPAPTSPPPSAAAPAPDTAVPAPAPGPLPGMDAVATQPDDTDALRLHLYGTLAGTLGAAPTVIGAAGGLGLELGLDWVSIGVAVRADLPTSIGVGPGSVEAHLVGGEASVCGWAVPIAFCGLGVVGAVRGEGQGFVENDEVWLLFAGVGARVALSVPIAGPLGFRAHADLVAHITPTELRVDSEVAWAMPPVSGVLAVGLFVSVL